MLARIAEEGVDHVCVGDHVSFFVGAGSDGLITATARARCCHPASSPSRPSRRVSCTNSCQSRSYRRRGSSVHDLGVQVAVVIGRGNYFRGRMADGWGTSRAEADNVGMLGTVMNASKLLRCTPSTSPRPGPFTGFVRAPRWVRESTRSRSRPENHVCPSSRQAPNSASGCRAYLTPASTARPWSATSGLSFNRVPRFAGLIRMAEPAACGTLIRPCIRWTI